MSLPPDHPFTRFTLTAEDYANALRLHMRRYWATRWTPKLTVLVIFLIAIAILVTSSSDLWTFAAIAVMISAAAAPVARYFFDLPRQARKVYAQQKTLHQPIDASWTPDAYVTTAEDAASTIGWGEYYGWSADEKVVLLMQSQALFQMLPRRALSESQMSDLLATIQSSGLKKI